jgi:hypothetical protein
MKPISELSGLYTGLPLWVVGRGPSLGNLRAEHFEDGPVIAINQAIEVVEALGLDNPVYAMQKDCYFFNPKSAPLLVHEQESLKNDREKIERYKDVYVFDNRKNFEYSWNAPSVVSCVGIAKLMGCSKIIYLCCDSVTDGVLEAYGAPATDPRGYIQHGPLAKATARNAHIPAEWRRVE